MFGIKASQFSLRRVLIATGWLSAASLCVGMAIRGNPRMFIPALACALGAVGCLAGHTLEFILLGGVAAVMIFTLLSIVLY